MFNVKKKINYTSFTLAEVLITLTIIGVVAALSIPSLMQKTQNQEYVTALKKFYAQANQALAQTAIDEGTPGKLSSSGNNLALDIANNFKKAKDCRFSTTDNCWTAANFRYDGKGSIYTDYDANVSCYKFITADGMNVAFCIDTCSNHLSSDTSVPTYSYCGDLFIDVNSHKNPNRYGRDVFAFRITSNKAPMLYPWGGMYDDQNWQIHCDTNGTRCAGRVFEQGWEMNY